MNNMEIRKLKTEEELCKALGDWCAQRGYTPMSADELYYELASVEPRPEDDLSFLNAFIDRWEDVVDERQRREREATYPKIAVEPHWERELTKLRAWLTGFGAGRGVSPFNAIPGEDVLRQIQIAIQDAGK